MQAYHIYFLIVHITAGIISLIVAPIAFLTVKGGRAHRLWGKVYFYAMAVIAVTAITMSIYHKIPFLLMVAIFSFTSAVRGYRTLFRKKTGEEKWIDYTVDGVNLVFCSGLLVYAVIIFREGSTSFAIISIVFGLLGCIGSLKQLQRFKNQEREKRAWLYEHIVNMSASYIASVTAFLVNVVHFLPAVVTWLAPVTLGVPLIFYTVRKYKKKYATNEKFIFQEKSTE